VKKLKIKNKSSRLIILYLLRIYEDKHTSNELSSQIYWILKGGDKHE